jgi:ribosomal protein L7/L12
MKSGALVFLAAFLALAASWGGFVLAPQVQLGREMQTNAIASSDLYPQARPGMAKQGAEVYRSLGCVYCHSQQVGQEGTVFEVVLADAGTNQLATIAALQKLDDRLNAVAARNQLTQLPKTILANAGPLAADAVAKLFEPTGAKVETRIVAVGPDIAWGWGNRRTVAQDYLFDYPVQLGTRRIGPDLANVGLRRADANWHYIHLYAPDFEVKGSAMPAYRFLFEERKLKAGQPPSPDAIPLIAAGIFFDTTGPVDREIVPTEKARMLVAYLLSLHAGAPLFEAPVTPPPAPAAPATNAPTSTAAAK